MWGYLSSSQLNASTTLFAQPTLTTSLQLRLGFMCLQGVFAPALPGGIYPLCQIFFNLAPPPQHNFVVAPQ